MGNSVPFAETSGIRQGGLGPEAQRSLLLLPAPISKLQEKESHEDEAEEGPGAPLCSYNWALKQAFDEHLTTPGVVTGTAPDACASPTPPLLPVGTRKTNGLRPFPKP